MKAKVYLALVAVVVLTACCIDAFAQATGFGQFQKQSECLSGDAVLGVVQIDADSFGSELLAPPGVFGEERAQVEVSHVLVVCFECLPGRALCQWC